MGIMIVAAYLVLLICISSCTKNTEVEVKAPCLDLAFCNLLRGDIAHANKKIVNDSRKFFKEAEKDADLYLKDVQGGQDSGKKYCTRVYKKCYADLMEMIFRTGSKIFLEDRCAFMDYSYTALGCKNVQNWPQKVRKVLPEHFKHCKIDCSLDFDKPATPRSRNAVGKLRREKRDIKYIKYGDPNRHVDYWIRGPHWMNDLQRGEEIGYSVVCKEGSWSDYTDAETDLNALRTWVALGCTEYNPANPVAKGSSFIEGRVWEAGDRQNRGGGHTYWNIRCRDVSGAPNNSFIIGMSPTYIGYGLPGYTRAVAQVDYMCANDGSWTKESMQDREVVYNDEEDMRCPFGYAVCGLQTRGVESPPSGPSFMTDLQIACCLGDIDHIENFVHKDEYEKVMKLADEIGYTLQF